MWKYIIYVPLMTYVAYWLIAVIRQRMVHGIYEACGMGCYFTLVSLGWGWTGLGILPLQILGLVLYAPAILFVAMSFIGLRTKGKPEDSWERTTKLIDTGVFQVTRHPMYFGTAIWTVGVMLCQQSIPSLILGLVAVFCFFMASTGEDKFNLEKFGDEYREYMTKVPVWNIFTGLANLQRTKNDDE
jgi:protein-S-isoprenylcysteine O-methyltransferase Ste14